VPNAAEKREVTGSTPVPTTGNEQARGTFWSERFVEQNFVPHTCPTGAKNKPKNKPKNDHLDGLGSAGIIHVDHALVPNAGYFARSPKARGD
jgi:hypothetical protein